jgi:hypothetical protein
LALDPRKAQIKPVAKYIDFELTGTSMMSLVPRPLEIAASTSSERSSLCIDLVEINIILLYKPLRAMQQLTELLLQVDF